MMSRECRLRIKCFCYLQFIILSLVGALSASYAHSSLLEREPERARQLVEEARAPHSWEEEQKGKGGLAWQIELLTLAIHYDALYHEAWFERGLTYLILDEPYLAYRDMTEAIRLAPEPSEEYRKMRDELFSTKEFQTSAFETRDSLWQGVRGQANSMGRSDGILLSRSFYVRGQASMDLVRCEAAAGDFSADVARDPFHANGYVYRGRAYYCMGQYEMALADFSKGITAFSHWARERAAGAAHVWKGRALRMLKRYAEADENFSEAISIEREMNTVPSMNVLCNAFYERALVQKELKRYERVIEDLSTAVEFAPESSHPDSKVRGDGPYYAGNPPTRGNVYRVMADLFRQMGDSEREHKAWQMACRFYDAEACEKVLAR